MMKKLRRPVAFMAAVAMIFSMLYLPDHAFNNFGLGITASAEENTSSQWIGGGSEADPYRISNLVQFVKLRDDVNRGVDYSGKYFKLTTGIDLGGSADNPWTPIGDSTHPFKGIFDGDGYMITGLYIDSTSAHQGLFGYLGKGGVINNLGVGGTVSGSDYVGGVCGKNESGTIETCYTIVKVKGSGSWVGGVCGYNNGGTIENCYNAGTVSGSDYVGGVCGKNESGTIESCYNIVKVEGSGSWVGGVCGYNNGGTIENCSNSGTVSGSDYVGGVCGLNYNNTSTIICCNNTGTVSGSIYVSGVCGYNKGGTIENCSNSGTVSGSKGVGGVCGDNEDGTITHCYNTGKVSGNFSVEPGVVSALGTTVNVGGVCGNNCNGGTIENCYNTGEVSCTVTGTSIGSKVTSNVGGVCGNNAKGGLVATPGESTGTSKIKNCYNVGAVSCEVSTGSKNVGNVCGKNSNCTIENCYYRGNINRGESISADGFTDSTNFVDWDFTNTWEIDKSLKRPVLRSNPETTPSRGEADDPYQIRNFVQLIKLRDDVNRGEDYSGKYFKLTADINLGGSANNRWTPIGDGTHLFKGIFDGDGHKITGLYIDGTSDHQGLFGYLGEGGVIKNLGVDGTVSGNLVVGGVCGHNYKGTITNCTNTGTVNGSDYVGGVCGQNESGTIENCYNIGKVEGRCSWVGGVCGYNYEGTITNCHNAGTVSGASNVGGVCGYNTYSENKNNTITNCYNTGTVSGTKNVGGVCGQNESGTIENCYNIGKVEGSDSWVGGVCGYNSGGTIENCYNAGTVSGKNSVGGVCGYIWSGTITSCYNTGSVSGNKFVGGVCGYNRQGAITNCYYLAESETDAINGTTFKTTADFNSGEVAYLLAQGENGSVWGQDLSIADSYPVLDSTKTVYPTKGCTGYANEENYVKEHTDEGKDGICDDCGAEITYKITLDQMADGSAFDGASLSGGGTIRGGSNTTIAAPAVPGYTFLGWYNGETLVSANLSFEYTPTKDVTLTATYQKNRTVSVTIDGGTGYTISINGGTPDAPASKTTADYAVGTVLTVTATAPDFAYWQNEAGSVLSRSASYTFTVVNGATVTAVYNTKVDSKAIVSFISGYDQIINRYQITAEGKFTVPAAPTKTGCDFAGWSINGGEAVTEHVADAVKAAITAALATDDTSDDVIHVKATYTAKVQDVTVTVTNGTGAGTYNVNDVVTVTANAPESGYKFSHWTDGTNMLSYNTSYSFYAAKDIALTAVYVEEATEVEAKGITEIVDVIKDTVNGKISFVSMSTVPEGCKIQKAGLVATMTAGDFDATNARAVKAGTTNASAYRYTWTVPVSDTDVIYVRAYLVYTDKNDNVHTIYSDIVSGSLS